MTYERAFSWLIFVFIWALYAHFSVALMKRVQPRSQGLSSLHPLSSRRKTKRGREERPCERGWRGSLTPKTFGTDFQFSGAILNFPLPFIRIIAQAQFLRIFLKTYYLCENAIVRASSFWTNRMLPHDNRLCRDNSPSPAARQRLNLLWKFRKRLDKCYELMFVVFVHFKDPVSIK